MSAPARRCQKVSPCAGVNSARTATATNSRPTAIASNDSPRANRPARAGGAPRSLMSAATGRHQHGPPVVAEARLPAIRAERFDRLRPGGDDGTPDLVLLEEGPIRRA